jgi:Ca2+/Na+ antiporter
MAALTTSYRLAVASRAIAAILGGYVLSALATFALAIFLPMSKAEASMTATLLSFLIYTGVVLWVFATRTAGRAWVGIVVPSVVIGALIGLQRLVVAS